MAMLVILSVVRVPKLRSSDQMLGSMAYPLYLYREDVLVVVLTFTTRYCSGAFVGAMLASVLVASLMTVIVDASVDR